MKNPSYFSNDIVEFLHLLDTYNVRYLLVGGEAVIYYGYARLTGDIDVFYDRTETNVVRLFKVLKKFWDTTIPGVKNKNELMKKGIVFQFGIPPNRIDLLNTIDGVSFNRAWKKKEIDRIFYKKKERHVYFIGLDDLIMNKKAVRRNKDKDDLRFLREAQILRKK